VGQRQLLTALLLVGWLVPVGAALCSATEPNVVRIRAAALARPLVTGQPNFLDVEVAIEPGWHVNSNRPSTPFLIPTRVSATNPGGLEIGDVIYPAPQRIWLPFEPRRSLSVFSGHVHFTIPITPLLDLKAASKRLDVRIFYQACNDHECLRPSSTLRTLPLAALSVASTRSGMDPKTGWLAPSGEPLANIFHQRGYLIGFIVVFLAGLALNLTPCVYPLIGVTVAYFGYQGGSPRRVIPMALLYVLGIAVTFSALGVTAALSGSLFGAALQKPLVLSAIAGMLLVCAAASFGFVSFRLPARFTRRFGSRRTGYAGALVMGLAMGIVAAPCIGPVVVALLLIVQQSSSLFFGFTLFFTLAVGLGLPYVALALVAGSIRKLPRSGEWLVWVEHLFGFVLIALALYFIDPLTPNHLAARILPYYGVAVAIYLGFISKAGRNSLPFLVLRCILGTVVSVSLVYTLIGSTSSAQTLNFRPFNPTLLQAAKLQRKPVVLDFAADWCVPCREMERTTFRDPAVVQQSGKFIWVKANLTKASPGNAALMKQFAVAGVPTTVFIDSTGRVRATRTGYIGPREFLTYLEELK
jgi:thiol:disulfide interchange protein DsbD